MNSRKLNFSSGLYENSKHQKPNFKRFDKPFDRLTVLSKVEGLTALSQIEGQIPMTQIPNKWSVYICAKWHNYRQSKLCEAIRANCGGCFGHWILIRRSCHAFPFLRISWLIFSSYIESRFYSFMVFVTFILETSESRISCFPIFVTLFIDFQWRACYKR